MKMFLPVLVLMIANVAFGDTLACDITQVVGTEVKIMDLKMDSFPVDLGTLTELGISHKTKLGKGLFAIVKRPAKSTGLNAVVVSLVNDGAQASRIAFPHLSDAINSINSSLTVKFLNKELLRSEISCFSDK